MAHSLSERIAARTAKQNSSRSAQNRATFLALRADIKQAMDDGWPVKTIWETLSDESKVDFSYQAFRGYVNRLILSVPATQGKPVTAPVIPDAPKVPEQKKQPQVAASQKTTGAAVKPDISSGFKFNPVANKEELL